MHKPARAPLTAPVETGFFHLTTPFLGWYLIYAVSYYRMDELTEQTLIQKEYLSDPSDQSDRSDYVHLSWVTPPRYYDRIFLTQTELEVKMFRLNF